MKKKSLFIAVFVMSTSISFAQDNTIPTTGNVGIGTLNPTSRLEVNGNLKIDSCLIVDDSSRFNSKVTILDDLSVFGSSKFDGNTIFSGEVKMPNLVNSNNLLGTGSKLVMVDEFGVIKEVDFDELSSKIGGGIYAPEIPTTPMTLCEAQGYINNPVWHNGLNKIYAECSVISVGIGTNDPLSKLDVRAQGISRTI